MIIFKPLTEFEIHVKTNIYIYIFPQRKLPSGKIIEGILFSLFCDI